MAEEQSPHEKLVKAVVEANTPEPTPWVRGAQLVLAFAAMAGAIAIALILVLQGPPPPKEPTPDPAAPTAKGPSEGKGVSASGEFSSGHIVYVEGGAAEEGESGEPDPPGEGEASEEEEGSAKESASEGESEESLANLSKQGPWAFAIVALLVAAFIATGKSLGFSGVKPGGTTPPKAKAK